MSNWGKAFWSLGELFKSVSTDSFLFEAINFYEFLESWWLKSFKSEDEWSLSLDYDAFNIDPPIFFFILISLSWTAVISSRSPRPLVDFTFWSAFCYFVSLFSFFLISGEICYLLGERTGVTPEDPLVNLIGDYPSLSSSAIIGSFRVPFGSFARFENTL